MIIKFQIFGTLYDDCSSRLLPRQAFTIKTAAHLKYKECELLSMACLLHSPTDEPIKMLWLFGLLKLGFTHSLPREL